MSINLDPIIEAYKAGIIDALVENARKAHIIGDLLAQRHLHRAGKHTHAITNAARKPTAPPTESAGFSVLFDHVAKEAEDYLPIYKKDLVKRGGTIINGELVNWLDTHAEGVRQDIADAIEAGIKEGWSTTTLRDKLSEVIDGERWKLDRIARTEMMRVQVAGMMNRYSAAAVETVIRILGPNPCDLCAAEGGEEYPIDAVPDDHPNGACDFVPNIKIPPAEDTLIPEDQIAWLLEQTA